MIKHDFNEIHHDFIQIIIISNDLIQTIMIKHDLNAIH